MKVFPINCYQTKNNNAFLKKACFSSPIKSGEKDSFSYNGSKKLKDIDFGIKNYSVNFCGNIDNKIDDEFSYEEFIKTAKECGIKSEEDLISNIKQENLLGTGLNSKVYKFNDKRLDKWVLKEDKNPFHKRTKSLFEATIDELEGHNLGQEIAKSGNRYRILKRVVGEVHSLPDWSNKINEGSKVTEKEASAFLNMLKKVQNLPQSSFDNYASDLKFLQDKGYKQDSINPNNILIDYENEKIQIIDYFKVADPSHINSKYDLINALLDFSLFNCFYEKLDKDNQKEMIEYANNIIDKCTLASKKAGLEQDEETYLNFLSNVDKWFGIHLVNKGGDYRTRYNLMKDILEQNASQ